MQPKPPVQVLAPSQKQVFLDKTAPMDDKTTDLIAPAELDYLFSQFPLNAIWIRIHAPTLKKSQHFFHADNPGYFSAETIQYLASEQWLETTTQPMTVCSVDLDLPAQIAENTYICTYRVENASKHDCHRDLALTGYCLLWSHQPLTDLQKYWIERQVFHLQTQQWNTLAQLQLNQQIQTLKQTLHGAEHQLRTPLSLIEIYADLLQQKLSDKALRQQAQHIFKTVREINISLKRLTHWDNQSRSERVRCDLKPLVVECIEELRPYLEQKSIGILCDPRSLLLRVDPWQMKQVFMNLLNNAIAFSPQDATITCRWRLTQDEVRIEISDQGPGFSPHALANLFTPFYSCRPDGTGLGLVIAKDIIHDHQGRLWADNLPSGGAIISIALPRVEADCVHSFA